MAGASRVTLVGLLTTRGGFALHTSLHTASSYDSLWQYLARKRDRKFKTKLIRNRRIVFFYRQSQVASLTTSIN